MNTILVPVDFSEVTSLVVENAEKFSRALGATVYLLHVEAPDPDFVGYEAGPQTVRDNVAREISLDRHEIRAIREEIRKEGIETNALVFQGPTVETILKEAERLDADLIIIGSHGRGALLHLLMGSVCEGVMKGAACPVMVVHTPR